MIFAQGASRATSSRLLAMNSEDFIISKIILVGINNGILYHVLDINQGSVRIITIRIQWLAVSGVSRAPFVVRTER